MEDCRMEGRGQSGLRTQLTVPLASSHSGAAESSGCGPLSWGGRTEHTGRIVPSHFLWLYCLCPAPYCLPPFVPSQLCCLFFSSQPGCFHFFCLKFLRGRFYFQRFD